MRLWFFTFLVGVGGCGFGFDPLPDDSVISCNSDADCPEGKVCNLSLGRCVEAGADTTPPSLVRPPVITPATATLGQTVEIEFTVNEDLAYAPQVSLTADGNAYSFVPQSEVDLTFVYSLNITSAIPLGTWIVSARLADLVGNSITRTLAHVTIE